MVKETASETLLSVILTDIMCIISPWQRTVLASQEHWAGHMAPVLATIITNTVTNIVTLAAAILTNYGDYNFPTPLLMVLVTLMVTTLLLYPGLPQRRPALFIITC